MLFQFTHRYLDPFIIFILIFSGYLLVSRKFIKRLKEKSKVSTYKGQTDFTKEPGFSKTGSFFKMLCLISLEVKRIQLC